MEIQITIGISKLVKPAKCRKYREIIEEKTFFAKVKEVKEEEVKTAFIIHSYKEEVGKIIAYKGKLFLEVKTPELYIKERAYKVMTIEEASKYVRNYRSKFLNINGILFRTCYEPFYRCITFGLGNNHGGTGLFNEIADKSTKKIYGWPANETEKAIEGACKVANDRGDNESIESIKKNFYKIECFAPEFIKRKYYHWTDKK